MNNKPKVDSHKSLYWRANLKILSALLIIWFCSSCALCIFFVEDLNQIKWGGFPLGFWFAQQGTIYVFITLILIYAILMEGLDRKYKQMQKTK